MSQFIEMFNDSPLVRLEDHIETQSGGTPNTKKSEYYDGGTIPWLSSGEVNQGYISSTEKYITEEGFENSAAKWVPKNSVVIAMYGATAGKVGFITIPLTTNQAVCALLPNDAFNPLYLYYAVSSQKNWMIAQCRGAAQPNISQGIIRSMEIPMPSLSEQMQFVNIIKQADKSGFDGRKSQFIEMFKHKRPNGKIADLVDVNIKSVKKSFNKEDMIEYIDISSVNAKNRTLNETTQYIVASAPSRAQQCVQNGDILVSTVRPINRNVAVVNRNLTNLVASTGFCVLRPIDGYREYLLAIVTSDKYTEKMCDIASGGLYPAVNNSDVLSYDIFIPDKDFLHRVTQIYQQADKSGSVGLKSGLNFAKLLIHR